MKLKKLVILFFPVLFLCSNVFAVHIKGGLISYEYMGAGAVGTSMYKITVDLYRSCSVTGPNPAILTVYENVTYNKITQIGSTGGGYTPAGTPTKQTYDPCISNIPSPAICYSIFRYTTTLTLSDNINGYVIVCSDGNRVKEIVNIANSSSTGITFSAVIPGILNGVDYHTNSSPQFDFKDTALICYNSKFEYQFSATDKDNDVLTYSFGDGLHGTSAAVAPPFTSLPYTSGYSGLFPLGPKVTIDSTTGLISGIAPAQNGEYVIAVYVHEWRDGKLFNSIKKELQITVADCSLVAAALKDYVNCDNYTLTFQNETMATNIISYAWDFGVNNRVANSLQPTPTYTYADTGTYTVKLKVVNSTGCNDSATASVKVYPGFKPDFTVSGSCVINPFQFTDKSYARYGTINSWYWDLGDSSLTARDTFRIANVNYKYSGGQNANAVLRITSSVGCYGAFTQTVNVFENAYIKLGFADTLICSVDSLPLKATANGTFQWSPNKNISDVNILNPIVFPKDTMVYTLTVHDKGCTDSVKVKVNVLQFITVKLGLDSGICRTDGLMLRPVSDALSYKWRESTNANSLSDPLVKNPVAKPLTTTTYFVTGNLGYCQDSSKITINVSPYPLVDLGNDTAICYGKRIELTPYIKASLFSWTGSPSLVNTNFLNAIAGPEKYSSYILTVRDTAYCKKPVSDTINIRVVPLFSVNAGKDTSITTGQPLQLSVAAANGYYSYKWTPALYLDNDSVSNPIATVTSFLLDSIRYKVRVTTAEGCNASDDLLVRLFRSGVDIHVPSAFTPNGDGLNDILRPILSGIADFEYFKVFNRWGQLVYSTAQRSGGWDGTFKGAAQQSETYIYMVQGKSFDGKTVYRKGTSVLIR